MLTDFLYYQRDNQINFIVGFRFEYVENWVKN